MAIALTVAWTLAVGGAGHEPIGPLAVLAPFLGTSWVGRFTSTSAPPFDHRIETQSILSGQVVRWSRSIDELGFSMGTFFYWDREIDAVAFAQLASDGIHAKGVVEITAAGFALVGVALQPTVMLSFRQTFDILEDGTLEDRCFRRAGDAWLPEHVIVHRPEPSDCAGTDRPVAGVGGGGQTTAIVRKT